MSCLGTVAGSCTFAQQQHHRPICQSRVGRRSALVVACSTHARQSTQPTVCSRSLRQPTASIFAHPQRLLRQQACCLPPGEAGNSKTSAHGATAPQSDEPGAPDAPQGPSGSRDGDAATSTPSTEQDTTMAQLGAIWDSVKQEIKKSATPEEVAMLESIDVEDLLASDNLMRKVADQQLGPILKTFGVEEEPLSFFVDLLKIGLFLQFTTAGMMFYGMELWGNCDAGEAWRAVCGLSVGYLTRPFNKVELILAPVYDNILGWVSPNTVYEIAEARPGELRETINKLSITVGAAFLIPQFLWGWDPETSLQFVLPVAGGWFLFDFCYMFAMIIKLRAL